MAATAVRAVTVSFGEHGLAILRMQRGENRINDEFVEAFNSCLDEVERNPNCKGLITIGAEAKFFCNGIDLQWLSQQDNHAHDQFMINVNKMLARILTFPLPTVTAINGHCFGTGAVLALSHDVRVMNKERGWLSLNEVLINVRLEPFPVKCVLNPNCKGLITTAEGKFFSNGLDLQWLTQNDAASHLKLRQTFARLLTFPLPTVAAINGHCFAGGAILAFMHDVRVMNSERGWISLNEVFINVRLSPFSVKCMQLKVNPKAYHNMIVFGQRFTGPEAESAGLIDKAVPPSLVENESQKLLRAWLGKEGFLRESLHNMKKDVYADALKEVNAARL